ncbi:hypothetical protein O6H91_13G098000 [Diphasiastrum complanatum]|uniref:Uncharacterized protein n=3 Tax=Diphasiastrum complanatum TaxID=34168 RepID=A0ACC2BYR9_DIPCM|nr:hypothetical protein O6H91_13G098000 [Diphasiastrum complanatum]KAJ7534526.1 hypothetical protein O6H91_13G098000 [Diphasiastrum complanatum]KAJ7534527.1 hypothetical protein O6H91_13G098000 [Diphasiastrum complanatum]
MEEGAPGESNHSLQFTAFLPKYESLEQFLEHFFSEYLVDEMAQRLLRDALAKNMIHSLKSLSMASPKALILSGFPAIFIDECNRFGIFNCEGKDDNLAAKPPSNVETGLTLRNAKTQSAPSKASQGVPYKRDTFNSQRAENWSLEEIMALIEAKQLEYGRSIKKRRPASAAWPAIANRIFQKNVQKTTYQCWTKWAKINKHFKKIYRYEKKNVSGDHESYWNLSRTTRKEKFLPPSFHKDIYNAIMVDNFKDDKEAEVAPPTAGEETIIQL